MKSTLIIFIISFISLKAEDTLSIKDESYKDWKFGVAAFNSGNNNYISEEFIDMFNFGAGVYTEKHIVSFLNRNLSIVFSLQYINKRVNIVRYEDTPFGFYPESKRYKERNHYLILPSYFSIDLYRTNNSNTVHKLLVGAYGGYLLASYLDDAITSDTYNINNYNRSEYGYCIGYQYDFGGSNFGTYLMMFFSQVDKIKEGDNLRNFSFNYGFNIQL